MNFGFVSQPRIRCGVFLCVESQVLKSIVAAESALGFAEPAESAR
jgi:hypothetical protein